jgi:lysozyme family protein
MAVAFTDQLKNEYQHLFDTTMINANRYADVDASLNKILAGRSQYDTVAAHTGIPWYFIGIIHNMECSCNFKTHLHNGDPLTKRTTHVPIGYPKTGNPPFSWTDSAEDALRLKSLDLWTDWSVPAMLFQFERYNGFGYRRQGINSPYLWSFSNHYLRGKFTSDGIFDPNAVSKQVGAAVLLRRMSEKQIAIAGEKDLITQIKTLGSSVLYDPDHYHANAEQLQILLNRAGQHLKVDGEAGRNSSDALFRTTGRYLKGDPKIQNQ